MPSQPSDVRFFCFQNLVNKMWIGVASQDKMEIRSCLPKLLLAQHKTVPYFIRNKLCKVIVDIGRQDWPMFYHDFFTNTLQVRPACGFLPQKKRFRSPAVLAAARSCLCLIRHNNGRILSRKVINLHRKLSHRMPLDYVTRKNPIGVPSVSLC